MDVSSFCKPSLHAGSRPISGTSFERRTEKRSNWQSRRWRSGFRFSLLRHGRVNSLKSTSVALEPKRRTRLSGSLKESRFLNKYEFSKLDSVPVWRAVKAEQEPKEKKDDEQTGITKNEQNNQLWKDEDGPTVQARVQIFSSTLFWVFMFFMASIWDREDNFRRGRGGDRNNRR